MTDQNMHRIQATPALRYEIVFSLLVAWIVILLTSILPDILFRELGGGAPAWLAAAKVSLIGALLSASFLWKKLRPLRLFFIVVLTVFLLEYAAGWVYQSFGAKSWLSNANPFVQNLGPVQIQRITSAGLLTVIMLALLRRSDRFFFVKGQLDAPARPIPWVLDRPPTWQTLGPAISAAMCFGLVIFICAFGNLPSLQSLKGVLPLLPYVLIFAASNAFGEEMLYRAPWLAALESPIGPTQALLLTSVFFGISHFYGVPYGALGVLMAFIPGWLMGKAMLETRGFLWAWTIHFCMDFVIFFFMALGSVSPGG